jgi:hypothetical protein
MLASRLVSRLCGDWVATVRRIHVTPHVAASVNRYGGSTIDGRTLRLAGYAMSQRKRNLTGTLLSVEGTPICQERRM